MQFSQTSFSSPMSDHAGHRLSSARPKQCSVTFPPIHATPDEHRGASAPAGAGTKRKDPQKGVIGFNRDHGGNSSRTTSAAGAPRSSACAADHTNSMYSSPFPAETNSRAVPPASAAQLRKANKSATHRPSRTSSVFSQDAFSARASLRAGKDRSLLTVAAFQHFVAQAEEVEAEAKRQLCEGHVGGALSKLKRALDLVEESATPPPRTRKGELSSNGPAAAAAALPPLTASSRGASSTLASASMATVAVSAADAAAWRTETSQRLAVMYTVVASNAGVRCGVTAEPLAVQKAYLQAAMRYLLESADENLFPEWKRSSQPGSGPSRNSRSASARSSSAIKKPAKKRKPPVPCCLADGTEPNTARCQLLRCAVRNNAAVCTADRFSRGGQARTAYELLKALVNARGVWCGVVLYNLAVAFLDVEHYDDAAEAIARCMELSFFYLQAAENSLHDPFSTTTEAACAIHASMARQIIHGHHFIATMAAWCDPAGPVEVQHCEMAMGCATRYLSPADAKQHECQRRLAAAHARKSGVSRLAAAPLLPYVSHDFTFPGAPAGRTTSNGATDPPDVTMLVEGLFSLSSSSASPLDLAADLPPEVLAYVRAAKKGDALRFWVKEAQRGNAAPPFLTAADALAPLPALLCPSSTDGAGGIAASVKDARPSSRKAATARGDLPSTSPTRSLDPTTSSAHTPPKSRLASSGGKSSSTVCRPSKPAPYFVTTLPQSTFRRYRTLRASVVTQMENEEVAAGSGAAADGDQEGLAAGVVDDGSDVNSAAKLETGADVSPYSTSGTPGRSRRMTALLYGAAGMSPTDTLFTTPHDATMTADLDGAEGDGGGADDADNAGDSTTVLAITVRPSELLRQLDTETEVCYSRLVADPLADAYRSAAIRLQSWWRSRMANHERKRRSAAVLLRCREDAQAFRIQCCFRMWRRRRLQAAQRERKRQERLREKHVRVVQAFLRHRESLELWGRACVTYYQQLVARRKEERRLHAAAAKVQSWWRMLAAQTVVKKQIKAIVRLQAFWRGVCERREQRRLRVHRRLAEEAFHKSRLTSITCVQRWWRGCQERIAARKCLAEKRQAIESYLANAQSEHDKALKTHLLNPDEAVAAMRTVLAVLAGAHDRRTLGGTYRYAQIRKRAVHRYVLKHRGRIERADLAKERTNKLRLLRRREEGAVATLRLQKWGRRWLPRRRAARRTEMEAFQHEAAAKIQATWRMYSIRQELNAFSDFLASDRHRYARRIQRAWRAHHAQRKATPLKQQRIDTDNANDLRRKELTRGHDAVVHIQPWYRTHRTPTGGQRSGSGRLLSLPSTPAAAARRIQVCWRSHFTKKTTQQSPSAEDLLPAMQQLPPNAASAYATWIQAFARSWLIQRSLRRLPSRKSGSPSSSPLSPSYRKFQVPQPPTVPPCMRVSACSGLGAAEAETDAVLNAADALTLRQGGPTLPGFCHTGGSAATTPTMTDHGHHSPSSSALPQSLSRLTSSTDKLLYFFCTDSSYEPYSARRPRSPSSSTASAYSDEEGTTEEETVQEEKADQVKKVDAEESTHSDSARKMSTTRSAADDGVALHQSPTTASVGSPSGAQAAAFPIPRPPAPHRIMCTVHCRHTPEEIAAATRIQAAWRGIRARCDVEYYYEEYYEEVEVNEEDGNAE
ncbi:hypothetical protein ABB37_01519 [Leptomonas pyrrhocoris]|uniref:Uncharacterized protein n=1 Tax=Leptomonas pyrrhocoris TaxID=157538 RepID=A0A0N0VH78_LEPPY|nr:hypothetical protein ABB37_01519 [Leptomonas pyrrhocoris]XP_015663574.1 hypothetical protein ABB37_01519 [Leptomonas pyrrhocoris]KPA85134.1 hypothetical protein ABB37_01519 [Leptomonas pyrrhocoris]KPA85135.1 hypothetical protein ABB37_01519 [Leptomonas pyrrhocoris]|eukprot:XP_015663573.1 hypothetical protein ABB37_01519 [Leptomonas pyrrhocoris]